MKLIIAGSRVITNRELIYEFLDALKQFYDHSADEITEVVSGTAKGVDEAGEAWAELRGIEVVQFPANWKALGKRAGLARNVEMAEYADALAVIWDGYSTGTGHMIATMLTMDKPVHYRIVGHDETKTLTEPF